MTFFSIQIILCIVGTLVSQVNFRVLYSSSILKEISPEYSLEGLILKLKLQYFGHLMRRTDSLEKTLMLGMIKGRRRRGRQKMRWLMALQMNMSLSSGSWRWAGKPGVLQSMGHKKLDMTE